MHVPAVEGPRAVWIAALALLACYGVLAAATARGLGETIDEPRHLFAGRASLRQADWTNFGMRVHGPLGTYLNQTWLTGFDDEDFLPMPSREMLVRGRLGMLPFGLATGLLVFLWSRRLFGGAGALLALGCFTLNPVMIGYGALVNVDMAVAAFTLGALYCLWRHAEMGKRSWVVALGLALGCAVGTKYNALALLPGVALCIAVVAWRREPSVRGVARAAGLLALLAFVVYVTLHATFRFQAGFASPDAESYHSAALRGVASVPGLDFLLAGLPHPLALGADERLAANESYPAVFLMGSFGKEQWSYYAWTFLLKTPEVILLFVALVVSWRSVQLLRGRAPRAEALALWALLPCVGLPVLVLSFFAPQKMGVRYLLPYLPPLLVVLGAVGPAASRFMRPSRVVLAGAAIALLLAVDVGRWWPNLIGYYNASSGSGARAWRHFSDSNSDWGQYRRSGPEILRTREELPFEVLGGSDGPRFGRVAVSIGDLVVPDPENPERAWHWLGSFEPVAHLDAAWYVYDVTPEAFRSAADRGGERVQAELASAHLFAGELAAAAPLLDDLPPDRAVVLRRLARLQATPEERRGPEEVLSVARALSRYGRPALAGQVLEAEVVRNHPARPGLLAETLVARKRPRDIVALLAPLPRLEPRAALILIRTYLQLGDWESARSLLASRRSELEEALPHLTREVAGRVERRLRGNPFATEE